MRSYQKAHQAKRGAQEHTTLHSHTGTNKSFSVMKLIIIMKQTHSQVSIWGRDALGESGLFACLLGERGPFCVHFGEKWTFQLAFFGGTWTLLHTFWEKAGLEGPGGMFPGKCWNNLIVNYAFKDIIIKLYCIPKCDWQNKS